MAMDKPLCEECDPNFITATATATDTDTSVLDYLKDSGILGKLE
jgi:hypothetical protein